MFKNTVKENRYTYFQMKQFYYLLFFASLLERVTSSSKEFAQLGAISFLEEWTPVEELCPSETET